MITREQAKSLIDTALTHGKKQNVDGVEVTVEASDEATSRFANNGMTQNQSPQHVRVSLRVQKDGKQARLTTDKLSDAGLKELVDNAVRAASFLEKDPDMLPLPEPEAAGVIREVDRNDDATAAFDADKRAEGIRRAVEIAKERGLISAGIFATGSNVTAVGNSKGLFRYHAETSADASFTMRKIASSGESTGWSKLHSPKVADVDIAALATRAAEKAVASADPIELPPGKYTVIMEPNAVLDILGYMWDNFTGTSHIDKLSTFLGKVGQQVLGTNVSVTDDVFHPLQSGAPFDGEGLQRQTVHLIEHGVISQLVHGRRSAKKMGVPPTGHGLQEPSSQGEMPQNIVFAGGSTSLDEMIRSTERGVLLTRVWYIREVDPTKLIVTGMTRDGTFLVENGAIKSGIKNFRFNESLIDLLNNVVALGPSQRAAGAEGIPSVVPAMKVNNFNFASVTRF
jgi:PmbA protein